ncbi:hypothetical protein [Alkalihalobacillus sp. 1P02AB]|uniref:hypothetical protein n=1 Tax=Alkalihalobacillus sp. 1P02AB TaxID=3132260 RepID=UPI0039A47466
MERGQVKMNHLTIVGRLLVWGGFILFIGALFVRLKVFPEVPELFQPLTYPTLIIGMVLLLTSSFFRKRT